MPAVSTNHQGRESICTISSTGSRVVPATSETTTRWLPASAFSSEDLPTFGRPTSATRRGPPGGIGAATAETSGSTAIAASSASPEPRPCRAETGCGSPSPSDHSRAASDSWVAESTLLATRMIGRPDRRRSWTTRSSVSVGPTVASTTNSTASARSIAVSAASATCRSSPSTSTSQPPVSTSVNSRPAHSAG
jgi:hypothetical protein